MRHLNNKQNRTQQKIFIMELMNNLETINNKKKHLADNLMELSNTDWIKLQEEITNLIINFNKKVKATLKTSRKRPSKILNKQSVADDKNKLYQQINLNSNKIQLPNNTTNRAKLKDEANNFLKILNSLKRFHSLHSLGADDYTTQRIGKLTNNYLANFSFHSHNFLDTTSVIWSNALLEYNNNKEDNSRTSKHQTKLFNSWDETLFGTHSLKYNTDDDRETFLNSR